MPIFKKVAYFAPRYAELTQADATIPASCYIFVADDYYDVVEAKCRFSHVGGAAAAADVFKVPSGTALGSGTSVLTGTFDLTATADTTYTKARSATQANVKLAPGDALAVNFSGTLTALTGFCLQVCIKPTAHPTAQVR